jgi:hypothetical protein
MPETSPFPQRFAVRFMECSIENSGVKENLSAPEQKATNKGP